MGDRGFNWNEDDLYAPATNNKLSGKFVDKSLIDLDLNQISENSLGDNSGNNNLGILINDYRIDFDEETLEPRKKINMTRQKIEKTKRMDF